MTHSLKGSLFSLALQFIPQETLWGLVGGGISFMHLVVLPARMLSVTMEVYPLVYIILLYVNVQRHELYYNIEQE